MTDPPRERHVLDIPPLYFGLAVLAMISLHRVLPIVDPIDRPLAWLGWLPIIGGVGLAIWAERLFSRAGTGVRPFTPSTAMVLAGPYRFSRNPMYLGMMLVLAGAAWLAGSLGAALVIVPFFLVIRTRFVLPEEEHMTRHFGDDYLAYKKRVRRWL